MRVASAPMGFFLPYDDQAEREANARLIAEAPETAAERDRLKALNAELLAALKAVNRARLTDASADWQRATDLTDAAIAKAEGGAA